MADFIIQVDGSIEFVHDDAAASFAKSFGELDIKRASHVEPFQLLGDAQRKYVIKEVYEAKDCDTYAEVARDMYNLWFADMTPLTGSVLVLGPFDTREEALTAERVWIDENHLGCNSCCII